MANATWLADVLRNAGCKVIEEKGWQAAGVAAMGTVKGVLLHHTAGALKGNAPSLNLVKNGRPDLEGPLSQLLLARDGTYHVLAAGKCNHAGRGEWRGVTAGNSNFIGIEAENAGTGADPWPDVQMAAYLNGVAAILRYIGAGAEMAAGHKEYALPRGRKIDPSFDMGNFRKELVTVMEGGKPPVGQPMIPDPKTVMLKRGMHGADVRELQRELGLEEDGDFGPATEKAVKAFQTAHGLEPDGLVGPQTWAKIDHD